MYAIQGVYQHGKIKLNTKPPQEHSNVIVIFPKSASQPDEGMSTEEALRIIDKHAGSIKYDITAKDERLVYLDERYGGIN